MSSLRFAVRVKPGAKRDAVGGAWQGAHGTALVVAVSAPAVDGKATDAVRKAVAAALGVRANDVTVVRGHRSRDKVLELDPAPDDAADRLAELLAP